MLAAQPCIMGDVEQRSLIVAEGGLLSRIPDNGNDSINPYNSYYLAAVGLVREMGVLTTPFPKKEIAVKMPRYVVAQTN